MSRSVRRGWLPLGPVSGSALTAALTIDSRPIDAVLFDAGGIFVIPDPTVLSPLLAFYGATTDVAAYHRAHYRGMAAKSAAGSGERDWAVYNEAYVRCVGVPDHDVAEAAIALDRSRSAYLWRPTKSSAQTACNRPAPPTRPLAGWHLAVHQVPHTSRAKTYRECRLRSSAGVE